MQPKPTARPALERHDLEPDPEPTVQDVLEGLGEVLDVAVDLAEPRRSAARCLTVAGRVRAATSGHLTADELLGTFRHLLAGWRAEDGERS